MSELEKVVGRLEKAVKQLEISVVMSQLMVMQLDGSIEISRETMKLYLDALTGGKRKLTSFRRHIINQYFREK